MLLADFLFCSTELSKNNLIIENIIEQNIYFGNTVIDAMATTVKDYTHSAIEWIDDQDDFTNGIVENLGEPMKNIFKAIKRIVEEFDDVK